MKYLLLSLGIVFAWLLIRWGFLAIGKPLFPKGRNQEFKELLTKPKDKEK